MATNDAAIQVALKFLDQATAPLQASVKQIESHMSSLTSAAGMASRALGLLGISFSAKSLIGVGQEYEQALKRVQNVFQGTADVAVAQLERISARSKHLFDFTELARGAAKIQDSLDILGLGGDEILALVERATDISRAKGLELEETVSRLSAAIQGAAKSGRQLGIVVSDNYMQYTAFGGALKDVWAGLSDLDKAWWRNQEAMIQTSKYIGAAEKETTTLSAAIKSFSHTLIDSLEPALSRVTGSLAGFVNWLRKGIDASSRESSIFEKMNEINLQEGGGLGLGYYPSGLWTKSDKGRAQGAYVGIGGPGRAELTKPDEAYMSYWNKYLKSSGGTSGLPAGAEQHMTQVKGIAGATSKAIDPMKDWYALFDEGTRITAQNYDATDKYNAELDKLKYFLDLGAISQDTYSRAIDKTWAALVKANTETEGWQEFYRVQAESSKVFDETRTKAEQYAAEVEKLNYLMGYGFMTTETYNRQIENLGTKYGETADQMSQFAIQAARNIQDSLGDTLYNVLTGNFDNIGSSFAQMLARMAANAAAANIGSWLFGNFGTDKKIGGVVGDLFSWASGLFGGGKASGGSVFPGTTYLVGERGPELFTPVSSGTITPNSQIAVQGAPTIIINNNGQPVQAKQDYSRFNGRNYVIGLTIDALKNDSKSRAQVRQLLR